jgi:hypothetical protein
MAAGTPIRIAIDELGSHIAVLKSELNEGHSVELVLGETVIGEVCAKPSIQLLARPHRLKYEEIMARLHRDFPDGPSPIDSTAIIREDRDSRG